jgi:hypothetical protein
MSSKDEGGKAVPLDTEHGFPPSRDGHGDCGGPCGVCAAFGTYQRSVSALYIRGKALRMPGVVACGRRLPQDVVGCSVSTDL